MTDAWNTAGALVLMAVLAIGAQDALRQEIEMSDPVKPEKPRQSYPVDLTLDVNGFPDEYRLPLRTDICLDRVCNLLEATLVWDALGTFLRIEYADDNPLTKNDHDEFTPADYRRLDRILKDRESLLGRNPLDFFLLTPEEQDGVDGVTTATPVEVKNAVVQGAAYSSWALWHWANGEIQRHIHARTRTYCTNDYLLHCLTSGKERFIHYALRRMIGRTGNDERLTTACLELLKSADDITCRLALDVLARKVTGDELRELAGRLGTNPASTRMLLDYFGTLPTADLEVWNQLSAQLQWLDDHQDLKLALALLSKHARNAEAVRSNVEALLARNDRILSFRVHQFLGKE